MQTYSPIPTDYHKTLQRWLQAKALSSFVRGLGHEAGGAAAAEAPGASHPHRHHHHVPLRLDFVFVLLLPILVKQKHFKMVKYSSS